jgi:hypothetical protein
VKIISLRIAKLLKLLVILCISLSVSATTIKIGLIEYPPHMDFKKEFSESKLIQYTTDFFKTHGLQAEFFKYPNRRGVIELKKGSIDLLLPYDDAEKSVRVLSKPLFYSVPGLCFKKEKFIPILSALHRLKGLKVGIPPGVPVVSVLKNSGAILIDLQGSDVIERGLALTQRDRLDAFYHPSPLQVYHSGNKLYKELACSYFHGYESGVFIATSPKMSEERFTLIDSIRSKAINELSYEYYFAR